MIELKDINSYEVFNTLSYPFVIIDDKNSLLWQNKKKLKF